MSRRLRIPRAKPAPARTTRPSYPARTTRPDCPARTAASRPRFGAAPDRQETEHFNDYDALKPTRLLRFALMLSAVLAIDGCGLQVKYSLSGASIPPDAKTFSVAYFPNNAAMVSPLLSPTLTDALVDIFSRRTKLMQVEEGGDFAFEGEITNYTSQTSGVSSDEYATLNRLTITVRVRFTNALDEKASWPSRTFTAYEDYNSELLLNEVEGDLIPQIVEKIVTDIFQASASNW